MKGVSVRDLKPWVAKWHKQALPYLRKPFEETWVDFAEGWYKVKCPKGQGPLDLAFAKALQAELPAVAQQYEQHELRLLVSLCRELQRVNPDDPIF